MLKKFLGILVALASSVVLAGAFDDARDLETLTDRWKTSATKLVSTYNHQPTSATHTTPPFNLENILSHMERALYENSRQLENVASIHAKLLELFNEARDQARRLTGLLHETVQEESFWRVNEKAYQKQAQHYATLIQAEQKKRQALTDKREQIAHQKNALSTKILGVLEAEGPFAQALKPFFAKEGNDTLRSLFTPTSLEAHTGLQDCLMGSDRHSVALPLPETFNFVGAILATIKHHLGPENQAALEAAVKETFQPQLEALEAQNEELLQQIQASEQKEDELEKYKKCFEQWKNNSLFTARSNVFWRSLREPYYVLEDVESPCGLWTQEQATSGPAFVLFFLTMKNSIVRIEALQNTFKTQAIGAAE